ncbi:Tetraspanin-7 [Acorus gramineus]|uniref:Tetraspanin-7 n=1 Tax=Acorus gramineus TaxID=55184 RepID=A0AAV9B8B1_ACOGR|nr:Tetraspanin-7 [Acorus gramineus]
MQEGTWRRIESCLRDGLVCKSIGGGGGAGESEFFKKNLSPIQRKLCYGCESCKAGVLQGLKQNWKKLAILNITVTIVLVIVYSIGCCALRNNRAGYYKYR